MEVTPQCRAYLPPIRRHASLTPLNRVDLSTFDVDGI